MAAAAVLLAPQAAQAFLGIGEDAGKVYTEATVRICYLGGSLAICVTQVLWCALLLTEATVHLGGVVALHMTQVLLLVCAAARVCNLLAAR